MLVVIKELVLLIREACWLECYLEAMRRLRRLLDIFKIAPLNLLDKVESVLQSSLFSELRSDVASRMMFEVHTLSISDAASQRPSCNLRLKHGRSTCSRSASGLWRDERKLLGVCFDLVLRPAMRNTEPTELCSVDNNVEVRQVCRRWRRILADQCGLMSELTDNLTVSSRDLPAAGRPQLSGP